MPETNLNTASGVGVNLNVGTVVNNADLIAEDIDLLVPSAPTALLQPVTLQASLVEYRIGDEFQG